LEFCTRPHRFLEEKTNYHFYMWTIQKIQFFVVQISLAHLLLLQGQTKPDNLKINHENKDSIYSIPHQEQSASKVHLLFSQTHLQRAKKVLSNVLSCIMDQRNLYAI
jgi:hypothetical protein